MSDTAVEETPDYARDLSINNCWQPDPDYLPRRPGEPSPAHDVNMKMIDGLAGVPSAIDDRPESILPQTLAFGYPGCRMEESPEDALICVEHRLYVLFRDHQEMNRRLGIDIFESYAIIVLMQNPGLALAADNLAENAAAHKSPR